MSFAVRAKYVNRRKTEVTFREFVDIQGPLEEMMRRGWINYLAALKKRANSEILKRKSGRRYRVKTKSGGRRTHFASRPFESHANSSGDLRRSLSWRVIGYDKAQFGYGISTNASNVAPDYAAAVEFGTIGFKKIGPMAARPSLHDAVDREEVEPHWDRAFDKEFGF